MKFNFYQKKNPHLSNLEHNPQSGQIAVVILLVVVVMATLGLSELGQTTEDLFVSSQKEEATRVFNAAETGVEEALSDEGNFTDSSDPVDVPILDLEEDLEADVTVTANSSFRTRVNEGETATVDLTGASSELRIHFNTSTGCENNNASLMIAVYRENEPARYYFAAPAACSNRQNDEFDNAETFAYNGLQNRYRINGISNEDQLLRITPLYASTEIEVAGLGSNTVQSHTVRSTARLADQPENTIEQIIEVERSIPAVPSYMNYVLYSNGTIQHEP